jgi:L-fuconolactonase
MRIDSHHHFWNYSAEEYGWIGPEMKVLQRDFGPEDLAAAADPVSISGVVSVQARQTIGETEWLLAIAEKNRLVRGVVGWLPLMDEGVQEQLEEWSHQRLLKGLRHVVHDEPDDRFILGAEFNRGVAQLANYGFVYDILIFAKHLPATIEFVDRHPHQNFVLDHIAKPTIKAEQFDQTWKANFIELAKRENVSCKFSGVVTEVRDEGWTRELLKPYWDTAWEAFGSRRLMFGSDWPVCLLRSSYADWVGTVESFAAPLSDSEKRAFWSDNAIRIYGL